MSFLEQAFIYLAAAVVMVPVAKRLGLGSVIGYLIAGIVIGPFGLGFIGGTAEVGGDDIMHVAEFGVVMMLFVVGLELEPERLWRLRSPILGMGGAQVVGTALLVTATVAALGIDWRAATVIGMALSMSSTAIVLQSLSERSLLRTSGGQSAFSVLLFQDIAVIPMLAIIPLLATHGAPGSSDSSHATSWVAGMPGWAQTLAVIGAVAAVGIGGRFVVRPAFRAIARTRLRELFTAAALLLVVGTALLMTRVGLSPALGTFLAGVVLATSEFRHELQGDIEPFKGLLLGLFFIAVGSTIDFAYLASHPLLIAGLVLGIIALKAIVLFAIGYAFRLSRDQRMLFTVALPQVGEFAFVLLAFAAQAGVIGGDVSRPLIATVALTMALAPLLFVLNERVLQPWLGQCAETGPHRPSDAQDDGSPVLIAGFGSFGSTVGRFLRASGIRTTVLDVDSDRVDALRSMGMEVYYGDATRLELLHTAGAERARVLVLALDSPERTLELVRLAREHFPHLVIMARAFEWDDSHELLDVGVTHVYREALDASVRMGSDVLGVLGFRAHQAHRAGQKFRKHDEESIRALTARRGDRREYVGAVRRRMAALEELMQIDSASRNLDADSGWDSQTLREEIRRRPTLG